MRLAKDNYSTGIKIFDEQHKHFFELAKKISDSLDREESDKEKLFNAVTKLADYVFYHLSSEEEAFQKYQYPEADIHAQVHDSYRQKIQEHIFKGRQTEIDTTLWTKEFINYASDWLSRHIISMDMRYRTFFKTKGLE